MFHLPLSAKAATFTEHFLCLTYHFSASDLRRPARRLGLRQRVYNHQLRCIAPVSLSLTQPPSKAFTQMRRAGKRQLASNISSRQNDLILALKTRAHSAHCLAYLCVEAGVCRQVILIDSKREQGTRYRAGEAPQQLSTKQLGIKDFSTPVLCIEGAAYRCLQNGKWQAPTDFYRALQAARQTPCDHASLRALRASISAYAEKHEQRLQLVLLDITQNTAVARQKSPPSMLQRIPSQKPTKCLHRSGIDDQYLSATAEAAACAFNLLNAPRIALTLESAARAGCGNTLAILGMLTLFGTAGQTPRQRG
ncbi:MULTISPECIES: hypothetical protein [unclassified Undibacterium]|uniref:hypothetical protein n=1 Tax=unclassified Undibacterium TaxID=2630295 RepID=UPI002AC9C006|nr:MULTISPECIES: hypothetical protein [unclassified Undibacterium]MEB0137968.1 hypothetical protein [Undibacterium sp. CCC2.1]MEB0173118.1 hypothetical protein [Undibacterium sp. CCC1.1]MEB0174976.1 hypothetical protein [Undibacterium sp. CCC3.4]MEB0216116.1 hypothetical protein [Undibacterium sp. 5I2]WPX45418.1 hypothetical protein RHM61_09475 [Undibacterium sp. CCC3.4]